MSFDNSYTAVTGATYQASDYNTSTKGNFDAIWVGTSSGDMDYYTSATAKSRLALVPGGLLYAGASAPAWLAAGSANKILKSTGSAPAWGGIVTARSGGSATDWQSVGTTTRSVGAAIIQAGCVSVTTGSALTVTFPVAFTYRPLIFLTVYTTVELFVVTCGNVVTTSFTIELERVDTSSDTKPVNWMAIGE